MLVGNKKDLHMERCVALKSKKFSHQNAKNSVLMVAILYSRSNVQGKCHTGLEQGANWETVLG